MDWDLKISKFWLKHIVIFYFFLYNNRNDFKCKIITYNYDRKRRYTIWVEMVKRKKLL